MADYRKEIEARRKAAAKAAADMAAVRQVLTFAAKFKVAPEREHFADVMKSRDLTWEQITAIADDIAKADAKQAEKSGGEAAQTALDICQQAADQAVQSLESSTG